MLAANFAKVTEWFGSEERYTKVGFAVTGVSLLSVAFYPSLVTLLAFLTLAGGFSLTYYEYVSGHVQKEIASHERAGVSSALSMYKRISVSLAYPVAGYLADISVRLPLLAMMLFPIAAWKTNPFSKKK